MGDMHFYDPHLNPNLQGECATCGGRPDDPAHRGARIDALRVISAREAELRAEVERLTNEAVLNNAECDGLGSLLLSVQKDCIAEHKRCQQGRSRDRPPARPAGRGAEVWPEETPPGAGKSRHRPHNAKRRHPRGWRRVTLCNFARLHRPRQRRMT
jgi:hypothetical protein